MMSLGVIKDLCEGEALRWTNHILLRLLQRQILIDDVIYTLVNGDIIEQYPTDYPYPSCLVLGATVKGNPLHVVCGASKDELWLITAYFPSIDEWTSDFRTRKGVN